MRNPYRGGTREAKAWDQGYIDEHRRNPHQLELPNWIDKAQWALLSPTTKFYGLQNMMAMSDAASGMGNTDVSGSSAIAMLRGIPDEPPKFIVLKNWKKASNSRYAELQRLEKYCFLDMQVGLRGMYDREEARKNCQHTFEDILIHGEPSGERVCPKCGTLESLTFGG